LIYSPHSSNLPINFYYELKMDIKEIMSLIDDEHIKKLGEVHKIDRVNTKITGQFILKVFVQSALKQQPLSLRAIENLTRNDKSLSDTLNAKDTGKKVIDHSSLGKRLKIANVEYFKNIYEDIAKKYHIKFPSKQLFHIFDSTILTISSKLMKNGLNLGGAENDTHMKMTVSLKNSIPSTIRFCSTQSESSEDVAMAKAINEAKVEKEDIVLFDRGIAKAETFKNFDNEQKLFVTRVLVDRKHKILSNNEIAEYKDDDLTILEDANVHLYNKKGMEIACKLRLVKCKKANGDEIWFLSNMHDLSAHDITLAYKHRWSIEVLFKFLKQHLQFKHFISYEENGMKIYLYCLLIAAILFLMYKKMNNLEGYKIAMLQFMHDLHKSIIKDIVLFCGGDPDLVDQRL
jgi:Transposase DDE domain